MAPADNVRAVAVLNAFIGRPKGHEIMRGTQRLIFDQIPVAVRNRRDALVGISVMVRLFDGPAEVQIDPHRIILNPPTVPRANLTYIPDVDIEGNPYQRRIVGAPDPEAALIEAIWDSINLVPNSRAWQTRGTVTTVYATAPGGNSQARSSSTVYATARSGPASLVGSPMLPGQQLTGGTYFCWESFVIFNTGGIPDSDTVSAVVLSLNGETDLSTTDYIVGAASSVYDGGQVVTGDWVSGANIPTPELASWNSSGYSADYNAFTETVDFKTAINKTGNTSLILYSQKHRDNIAPTGSERVIFSDADEAGTTIDPKLDITHAAAAGKPWYAYAQQ